MSELVITGKTLAQLDSLEAAEPGSIQLQAKDLEASEMDAVWESIRHHGAALQSLEISRKAYKTHDLTTMDFAALTPHLNSLFVGRCKVNESVLAHPNLRKLKLKNSWLLTKAKVNLGTEVNSCSLEELYLDGVNWAVMGSRTLPTIICGPHLPLRRWEYSLDEDDSSSYPKRITFRDLPQLETLYLHVCGEWTLALEGCFPTLKKVHAASQRYGNHTLAFSKIADGSSELALNLRDKKGPLKGQRIWLHGSIDARTKLMHLIPALGGEVVAEPGPDLTMAVLDESEYEAHEDGSPSPKVAILDALMAEGADIEIIDDDYFTNDVIYDWF